MTATKAKEILEPIDKNLFIIRNYFKGNKCCSVGHLIIKTQSIKESNKKWFDFEDESEHIKKLRNNSTDFLRKQFKTKRGENIATVNNSKLFNYNEDNPKDRVIHLLDDMIKAGY